jgi:integrase
MGRLSDPEYREEVTFQQLFEEFLVLSEARGRSPTTLHGYRTAISGFWLPEIGAMPIGELTAHSLDMLYARLRTRERPAATSTVRRYHAILSAALNQAVKWHWIPTNVARLATLPRAEHSAPAAPSVAQVRALIAACTRKSDELGMIVTMAAVTGCRRGELAALRWCDYEDQVLHIRGSAFNVGRDKGIKTTKTGRHRRIAVHARLAEMLESWRSSRAENAARAGIPFGPESYLFSDRPGSPTPININTLSLRFRRVAAQLELPSIHFHSLRHFAATQLIVSGIDPRTAATRLGHANPSLTLRVYSHATSESELQAAEVGARILDSN